MNRTDTMDSSGLPLKKNICMESVRAGYNKTDTKTTHCVSHLLQGGQGSASVVSCHIHLPACLWIMDPHSRTPKKNTSHGNEVLLQDAMHLRKKPCYQRGSPCQDPAGTWTPRRPPDDRKATQIAVVWSCFPFIRSGQNHIARAVKGGSRQGRQRKGWRDNIREWTGLEFGKSQRAVENREKWRKLVAKSVVPQRPSRLRDWWWWWWWWFTTLKWVRNRNQTLNQT